MVEKTLLEQAANVMGIPGEYHEEWNAFVRSDMKDEYGRGVLWLPHMDDAQAFHLAVTIGINPIHAIEGHRDDPEVARLLKTDLLAATRLALLRVAASKASTH